MTPPPLAALALLGSWALMIVWTTSSTRTTLVWTDIRSNDSRSDEQSIHTEQPADSVSSTGGFPTADD